MSEGPGLFSNIGKEAKDLLTGDYSSDRKFIISTYSHAGLGLTQTAVKKGCLPTGDISAQYKYENTTINVKVDIESNISATLNVSEIVPSRKSIATIKLPDCNFGKPEVQYFHEHATFTTAVALHQLPAVDITCTIGNRTIAIAAEGVMRLRQEALPNTMPALV